MLRSSVLSVGIFLFAFTASFCQEVLKVERDFTIRKFAQEQIYFLVDQSESLAIEDINSSEIQAQFQMIPKEIPNFGNTDEVLWLKINIQKTPENQYDDYLLELAYAVIDSVAFYWLDTNQQWNYELTGDAFPFSQRKINHRNLIFPLPLTDHQVHTYYFRLHTKGTLIAPLVLHKDTQLRVAQVQQELLYGIYYGALLIMVFYNFFLFITLRDKNYLLYTFTIILNLIVQANLLGHTLQFLWGDQVEWANNSVLFFVHMVFMANLLFSISFLQVEKYHRGLYYLMVLFAIINGLLGGLVFVLDYLTSNKLLLPVVFFTTLLIFFSGIFTWIKGSQYARLFVLAWFFYLMSVVLQLIKHTGLLPDSFWTQNSTMIGSLIEIVLLSFALADRINVYRKQVEQAQKLALERAQENEKLISQQKDILEDTVAQKTKDLSDSNQKLQYTNDELQAINEELHQIQEELQSQRDFVESRNKDLIRANTQISLSINSAKTIQDAMLPYEGKLKELFDSNFVINRPKDVVSGDFYWLSQVGDKIIVVVSDCTGHGVPGAFMTLIGGNLLDKIVNFKRILDPASILESLHKEIQFYLKQQHNGNNYGMDMVIVALEKQPEQKKLTFAGAKNDILLWTNEQLVQLNGNRKSVGGIQNEKIRFENQEIFIHSGDWIYLGSDGLRDQNDVKRKKFGRTQINQIIAENHQESSQIQKEKFEAALDRHMEGTVARDDILWIGLQI